MEYLYNSNNECTFVVLNRTDMNTIIEKTALRKGFDKAIVEAKKSNADKGTTKGGFKFRKLVNTLILF